MILVSRHEPDPLAEMHSLVLETSRYQGSFRGARNVYAPTPPVAPHAEAEIAWREGARRSTSSAAKDSA
jgi:hypothetical protein